MAEQVKVTQEQARAIDELNKHQLRQIKDFKKNPGNYADWMSSLSKLSEPEMVDALYEGYEIEPEYKKDDWIVMKDGVVAKVVDIEDCGIRTRMRLDVLIDNDNGTITVEVGVPTDEISRHATPSEVTEEKERRTEKKLDKLLLDLSNSERIKLYNKLKVIGSSFDE